MRFDDEFELDDEELVPVEDFFFESDEWLAAKKFLQKKDKLIIDR